MNFQVFPPAEDLGGAILVFLLQLAKAINAQTAIIQFAHILHFVYAELYIAALAFGIGVCLALKSSAATVAVDGFVLLIGNRHTTKIKSPEVFNFRA